MVEKLIMAKLSNGVSDDFRSGMYTKLKNKSISQTKQSNLSSAEKDSIILVTEHSIDQFLTKIKANTPNKAKH